MLRNETLFVLIRKQRCCYTNLENQTALTNIIRDMILNSEINEFDVIIVGGGATGAGTARDCALRGMRVLLVERFDFAAGATGDRKSTRLNSSHITRSRMPSSA